MEICSLLRAVGVLQGDDPVHPAGVLLLPPLPGLVQRIIASAPVNQIVPIFGENVNVL